MQFIRKLPDETEIIQKYALTNIQKRKRDEYIKQVKNILTDVDKRKLLLIGPCSADREDAVLEYTLKLARLQEKVKDNFLIIPRIYTSKPRTNGLGYKGLLHRPNSNLDNDNLLEGIIATRKIHLNVIKETGMYAADEMLYPEFTAYTLDLLAYLTVGARSVENQSHRMTASGVDIPVGMKNPLCGDINSLLNSILAAQSQQTMIYRGWEVKTEGNLFTHAILRGAIDNNGEAHPNYHYEELRKVHDKYQSMNLKNMAVIVDCNHANSAKQYLEQIRIAKEVISLCKENSAIGNMIKGIMIESYLEDGAQLIGGNVYGKSITDSCLGWEKTNKLVEDLTEKLVGFI